MTLLNVHPDYVNFEGKPLAAEYSAELYEGLLKYIACRYRDNCWFALPREVAKFAAQIKPLLRHDAVLPR